MSNYGIYVDEYQDCSIGQHNLVMSLSKLLPTVILGDPMQGIFDFDDNVNKNSIGEIEIQFNRLGKLETPHRWIQAKNAGLGHWLGSVRSKLEKSERIDLKSFGDLSNYNVSLKVLKGKNNEERYIEQMNICKYFNANSNDSVVVIVKGDKKYICHNFAKRCSGIYTSIEEIEGRELFIFIEKLEKLSSNSMLIIEFIKFACKCMTNVNKNLPKSIREGKKAKISKKTKNLDIVKLANNLLERWDCEKVIELLIKLRNISEVKLFRSDLFYRLIGVLNKQKIQPKLTISEAAERFQSEFRFRGRPIKKRKIIATTLLIKGLEFDHAIVLDATTLSKTELYVALTRGVKTLTIISQSSVLDPSNGN